MTLLPAYTLKGVHKKTLAVVRQIKNKPLLIVSSCRFPPFSVDFRHMSKIFCQNP